MKVLLIFCLVCCSFFAMGQVTHKKPIDSVKQHLQMITPQQVVTKHDTIPEKVESGTNQRTNPLTRSLSEVVVNKPLDLIDFFSETGIGPTGKVTIPGEHGKIKVVEFISIGRIRNVSEAGGYVFKTTGIKFPLNAMMICPRELGGEQHGNIIEPKTNCEAYFLGRVFFPVYEGEEITIAGVFAGLPFATKDVFVSGSIYKYRDK